MRIYILRRLLQIVPTVLMITLVVFVMMRSVPGDPVVSLLGDAYTEEDAIKAREAYGLNKPILIQYAIWLGKLVQGDWGASILTGRPVLQDVLIRLPVTLELIVLSMGVALAIAIPAAIIGALRQNTWADYTATSVAMIGVSVPEFFLGILLLLVFSVGLGGLLPSSGWVYLPGTCPMMVCGSSLWGNMQHVLLPAIALGVGRAAILTRLLRASMLEVIRTEYVTTARAKGLSERPVVLKHALKNALIITVTVGISAFFSACLRTTGRSLRPLARAVVTYSVRMTSSMLARSSRVRIAARPTPSAIAGSRTCCVLPQRPAAHTTVWHVPGKYTQPELGKNPPRPT